MTSAERSGAPDEELEAWAASGAMYLTGRPDGPPLGPPPGFVGRLRALATGLTDVDVLTLLGERAAIAGFKRSGDVSCGGAARLLRTADGWVAVNLPRRDDVDLLPAWLIGVEFGSDAPWEKMAAAVAKEPAELLTKRAQFLGLPVATLPRGLIAASPGFGGDDTRGDGHGGLDRPFVVDLSSLWAGPLCTSLLQQTGARVVKVESVRRPDGARRGPAAFFDLLHAGQEAVAIDFRDADGRVALRQLIEAADVVVEASRPRALEQLGIDAKAVLGRAAETGQGPRVWVSITGYGRTAPGRDRVAFGDDAAVAGGLVAWDERGPCFLADAIADPCAGIAAAAGVLRALRGGPSLLDVSMRDVAAHLAGPDATCPARPMPTGTVAERPRARPVTGRGPALGEHTEAVLAEIRSR